MRIRSRLSIFFGSFAAALLFVGWGCDPGQKASSATKDAAQGKTEPENPEPIKIEDPAQLPVDVLELSKQSTVLIGNFEGGSLRSTGSGFIVGDGKRVVTNKHVVTGSDDKADPLKLVFFSGTEKARIVQIPATSIDLYGTRSRSDPAYHTEDIAYISLSETVGKPLKFTVLEPIQETMPVWALGFPAGTDIQSGQDLPTVTVHTMRIERIERQKEFITLLQLSGSPTFGNSGGPVINRDGLVVGVLQAKTAEAPIIFAVPSVRVRKMLAGRQPSGTKLVDQWNSPIEDEKPKVVLKKDDASTSSGPVQNFSSVLNGALLDESDLSGLTPMELTLLRNEPFARRGYIFSRVELRRAFSASSWYVPRTRSLSAVQRLLTKSESRNIDFIKRYQNLTGQNY